MRSTLLAWIFAALAAEPASAQSGGWEHSASRDEFTGESSYSIRLQSDEPVSDILGERAYPVLQLRCDKEGGSAYWRLTWPTLLGISVGYNQFIGTTEDTAMEVRFDSGRIYGPSSLIGGWPPEDPVGSSQSVATNAVKGVLRRALSSEKMLVRDKSFDGRTLTAAFTLAGIEQSVEWLGQHCDRL